MRKPVEADKIAQKPQVFLSVLLLCKIAKKGKCSAPFWSFNFLAKLMRAANCVRSYLNPFCHEVNKGQSIFICSQNSLFFKFNSCFFVNDQAIKRHTSSVSLK